ncbi:hypothetical protein [Nocardioides sp. WS12]|uniref:hypothetical protein n=1 Tax=Nocardioides sp. WS12 TaxID=2486272 RepID=UPI0015F9F200|nr:hypothetical protein [Nocardioides sp. WS12]
MGNETLDTWGPLATPFQTAVPEDPRPWRDNAFFCFWDPAHELYGVAHVSGSPNADSGRRARVTVQVGRELVEIVEPLEHGTWQSESISFEAETRLTVNHPDLSGVLAGVPLHGLATFAGDAEVATLSLDPAQPVQHHQRSALVTGELTFRGRILAVEGAGYRDRSWGYRDESATMREYVGLMWVFPDLSISALKLLVPGRDPVTVGFVSGPGGAERVTGLAIHRDGSGHLSRAQVTTASGRTLDVQSTRRPATFWCPMGPDDQAGPTLSAYDQFDHLVAEGTAGIGLTEQGILRQIV